METRTDTTKPSKTRKPRARQDGKQEAVERPQILRESMEELVRLKKASDEAAADFSEAIKAKAKEAGFLASVVRRLVVARAGDKFAEKQREVEQLALVFEEVKG